MFQKLTERDKTLAREIDKEKGVKNCWNFGWLDQTVSIPWKHQLKEKTVEVSLGDCISKINQAGKAHCDWCQDILNYGSNGKKVLVNHVKSDKHVRLLKLRTSNQSLGSFGSAVSPPPPLSLSVLEVG